MSLQTKFFSRIVLATAIGSLLLVCVTLQAALPSWWIQYGMVDDDAIPNDFTPVNQGQLKWIATNAAAALEMQLPGGAGSNIWALVSSLNNSNNYCPVNIGQLKYIAQPFYDRLIAVGYTTNYPWSGSTNAPNDYALANIGQVKNVFSFDISYDSDGDGIPDWWETAHGLDPNIPTDANATNVSSFAHGLSNLQVYWNPSVLITDNYSSCQDGIPDWWKVKCGYSAKTPSDTIGGNGSTLGANYQDGTNPNDSESASPSALLDLFDYGKVDLLRFLTGLNATQWTCSTNTSARIAQLRTSIEEIIPNCLDLTSSNFYDTNAVPYATLQSVLSLVGNTSATWSQGPLTNQVNELTAVLPYLSTLASEGGINMGVPLKQGGNLPNVFGTWTVDGNCPTRWASYTNFNLGYAECVIDTFVVFSEKYDGHCFSGYMSFNDCAAHYSNVYGFWLPFCWETGRLILNLNGENIITAQKESYNNNYEYCSSFKLVYLLYVPGNLVNIIPDCTHNRKNMPFRFWINDDADSDDISTGNSDLPGQPSGIANYSSDHVNGRSDLLDFFPVLLDLQSAFLCFPPSASVKYKLRQDDGALKAVYTDLTYDHAGDYLTTNADTYAQASVFEITADGVALSDTFLNKINEDSTKGVLLMEGTKATTKPLILEIWQDSKKVYEKRMPLSISSVNDMYRWVNLRGVAPGNIVPCPPQPANFPDAESNGKQFVFVHGYSVTEQDARAWNAEMFKRLYQSGSRAMFTGIAWRGDDGRFLEVGPPLNYWVNVKHAFETAESLKKSVALLPGGKYIAGHSLGNMVVSSAIVDHSMSVNAYFMLDAAVAMEAYDSTVMERDKMRNPNWQGYTNHLWSTDWYQLFNTGDGRRGLTWRNRFGNISNAYNFYSSTEDVLEKGNGQIVLSSIWATQEMLKGTWMQGVTGSHIQGGWGFSTYGGYHYNYPNDPPTQSNIWLPEQANGIQTNQLKTQPFFKDFQNAELYGTNGSTLAQGWLFRAQTLAEAIPALSFAAGRNTIPAFGDDNIDMNDLKRDTYENGGWPLQNNRWRHSDIRYVAYPFNHKVFDEIVNKGTLQ